MGGRNRVRRRERHIDRYRTGKTDVASHNFHVHVIPMYTLRLFSGVSDLLDCN